MSYQFYKILHVIGLLTLFIGFGAMLVLMATQQWQNKKARILAYASHGVGLTIVFVSGFGLLARLGHIGATPEWAVLKIGVWGLMAVIIAVMRRTPQLFWIHCSVLLLLAWVAIHLAVNKALPFVA